MSRIFLRTGCTTKEWLNWLVKKKNHKSEYEEGFWLVNNINWTAESTYHTYLLTLQNESRRSSRRGGRVPSLSTPRSTPVLGSRKRQSQALLVGCGLFGSSGGDEQLDAMQYFLYWNWYFCTISSPGQSTLSKLYLHVCTYSNKQGPSVSVQFQPLNVRR